MKLKKQISIILSIAILLSTVICAGYSASANPFYKTAINPVFGQTEARSILGMINEFRTSDDAWYWNKDNETITQCENLNPLAYDYTLEETAMKRAAEIAVYFSHTRPDGRDLWTAYRESGLSLIAVTCGENIAAGYANAAEVHEAWREDFADYENQNHRRNLLNKSYKAVGIGHAYYNGYHFWVEEFSSKPTESAYTEATDTAKEYSIQLSADFISSSELKYNNQNISIFLNEDAPLPEIKAFVSINSEWNSRVKSEPVEIALSPEFTVQNKDIAEIENGRILAKKEGTTAITAEAMGTVITIPITVAAAHQHHYEWKAENGLLIKHCTGCNEEISRLQFEDLGDYVIYADYVEYTSSFNKFISGTNPPEYTLFSPTTPITRAMFVAILYRMAGNPYENGNNPHSSNPFSDVNPSAYYYNAACWALDEGITNQTTFKPFDNVTREQTARFLFAYSEANNMLGDENYKNVNLRTYPDYDAVHSWAAEPLQWANYNDMITGTSQGYINPQGATQRIHATRILYGFGKACNIGNFE